MSTTSTDRPAGDAHPVLVTGAGGFVGANLVRRLAREGHVVTAVAREGGSHWRLDGLDAGITTVFGDLSDEAWANELIGHTKPRWIFHLAAHGAYSWQQDFDAIVASNLTATGYLLAAAERHGCEAVIHAGSSSEYGLKDHPASETEALDPNSVYAVTKAAATALCRFVSRQGGLRVTTLRLYSVYGPWEDPRRLIPALIAHGLEGELPPLVTPSTARDFVYVDDACDAFIRAAQCDGPPGRVYNIGSGRQTSLAELVDVAREVMDVRAVPAWGTASPRSWDTDRWVADPTAARRELGWQARTALSDGVRATVDWLRSDHRASSRYRIEPADRTRRR